jgi:hypothetical protein
LVVQRRRRTPLRAAGRSWHNPRRSHHADQLHLHTRRVIHPSAEHNLLGRLRQAGRFTRKYFMGDGA